MHPSPVWRIISSAVQRHLQSAFFKKPSSPQVRWQLSMDILTRSAKVRTPDVNKHHHDRCIVIALLETKVLGPTASLPQSIQPTFTSCGGDVLNNVRCLQLSTHVGIHCHESAPVHAAVLRIVSSPHFDGCLASSAFDE